MLDGEKSEESRDNIIILNDELGNEAHLEFLDLIIYNDEEYVALLPVEESGEVVILKLGESDNTDEESYTSVDDIDVLMEVFEIFNDKFNFID